MMSMPIIFFCQVCVPPTITLISSSSQMQWPMKFRRDQDITIDSMTQLNCTRLFSTTTQWTITGCTSNCSLPMNFDPAVVSTNSRLDIPARALSSGVYQLDLTVTLNSLPNLTSTARTYIAIVPMAIRPNLVELGTLIISRGQQQNLLLNPGLHSRDSEDQPIFASVSELADV